MWEIKKKETKTKTQKSLYTPISYAEIPRFQEEKFEKSWWADGAEIIAGII